MVAENLRNKKLPPIEFEDVRIMYKNFRGEGSKYNAKGKRNFCLRFDTPELRELAKDMAESGWHIRETTPRDPDEDPIPYTKINVNYDGKMPPKIYLVTKKKKTLLDAETVGQLDYAEILSIDLVVSQSIWERDDDAGISGYVKNMYVTVVEDSFAEKYEFDD